ncbi:MULTISPECIES: phosphopantothenate--cysteine ligase family flavoprotein [Rothia]|jgi:phosphopantothenoylcysteine synthetase/decarboxylase|uniref:bifunctional phosphopantothenoylcysteine decarboxylase/phosphopantothenate synthase n=1 Tax=Rothia TaxID=32207 RepID=UPI0008A2DCC7|nr:MULTISPECIES: bifunctional phosphopantothenoylcysteine decarboxylase/phosphopantothenate synthase [Rothia]MBF1678909.1 bifunctional phosphopantothenoylcysteine decarboxylase/phosphopantothenate synthase [Rothia sp. (in: high G+C Gram-positive bacteria)]OFJ79203.1 phosphopantothenoylcysteine decarboxylase [Rothia sp. HMSC069C10]
MRIIVGIGGGIAAYKAAMLLRLFAKNGDEVIAMPTPNATKFVGVPTLEALSGNPVSTDVFDRVPEVNHVRQAEQADAVVIAPATADLLARLAAGRADDLLSSTVLTTHAPVILAPAMHTQMWEHPATQANVQTLRSWGYHVIEPAIGRLTGPDSGPGRMPEPEDIFAVALDVIERFPKGQVHPVYTPGYAPTEPLYTGTEQERMAAARQATLTSALLGQGESGQVADASADDSGPLSGRLVVITAGGTREALDPVRFLGNRSTGKQGVALAEAARDLGATVHLIGANLEVPAPEGVQVTRVVSALELREATLEASAAVDVLIMSAAVADFRPAEFAKFKIKKSADSEDAPVIQLVRNPDILREVVVRRQQAREAGESTLGPKLIVGFAAETGSAEKTPLELGREKLQRKGTDFLAVNTVGVNRGFGTDDNTITLLSTLNDEAPVFSGSKKELSVRLLEHVAAFLPELSA